MTGKRPLCSVSGLTHSNTSGHSTGRCTVASATELGCPEGVETLVNQSRSSRLRIGIDLVAVGEVAASLARFGLRYTNRVFTANQRIDCEEKVASDGFVNKDVEAARYAARFAAKEAVIKVLRPSGAWPQWRSIAMMRAPYGGLTVALHDIATGGQSGYMHHRDFCDPRG